MEHLGLVRGCGAPNWIGRERKGHVGTSGPCHPGRSDPRGRPRAWRAKGLIASRGESRFLFGALESDVATAPIFQFLGRLRGDPQGTPRRAGVALVAAYKAGAALQVYRLNASDVSKGPNAFLSLTTMQ